MNNNKLLVGSEINDRSDVIMKNHQGDILTLSKHYLYRRGNDSSFFKSH